MVGNIGFSFRMAYTVMDDSVNLGSRIEVLAKYYGVDIIVSEFVKAQTPNMIYRELDLVRVKGKVKLVTIFEPLSSEELATEKTLLTLDLYHDAFKSYRNCDWSLAEKQLKVLEKMATADSESALIVLYALYKERIAQFKKVPPPTNWDGTF